MYAFFTKYKLFRHYYFNISCVLDRKKPLKHDTMIHVQNVIVFLLHAFSIIVLIPLSTIYVYSICIRAIIIEAFNAIGSFVYENNQIMKQIAQKEVVLWN